MVLKRFVWTKVGWFLATGEHSLFITNVCVCKCVEGGGVVLKTEMNMVVSMCRRLRWI